MSHIDDQNLVANLIQGLYKKIYVLKSLTLELCIIKYIKISIIFLHW